MVIAASGMRGRPAVNYLREMLGDPRHDVHFRRLSGARHARPRHPGPTGRAAATWSWTANAVGHPRRHSYAVGLLGACRPRRSDRLSSSHAPSPGRGAPGAWRRWGACGICPPPAGGKPAARARGGVKTRRLGAHPTAAGGAGILGERTCARGGRARSCSRRSAPRSRPLERVLHDQTGGRIAPGHLAEFFVARS